MSTRDKISKASWIVHESSKDAIKRNLAAVVSSGAVKLDRQTTEKVLTILLASIDEGYDKGMKSFLKTVDSALAESYSEGFDAGRLDATQKATSKKN